MQSEKMSSASNLCVLPNQLVPRDRNPPERGFRPVNSDR